MLKHSERRIGRHGRGFHESGVENRRNQRRTMMKLTNEFLVGATLISISGTLIGLTIWELAHKWKQDPPMFWRRITFRKKGLPW